MSSCAQLVVLMHYPGKPTDPHGNDGYTDPLIEIYDWLEARIDAVIAAGVERSCIIADPGIGFGKRSVADNLVIMNGLALYHGLGVPIARREPQAHRRRTRTKRPPTSGLAAPHWRSRRPNKAQIIRVHDVFESVQAIRIRRGHRDAALSPADAG